MCFAAADEPLLLPSLERFKRLGIVDIAWRPEREGNERESKRLIRESSVFQICWSISAKVRSCMYAYRNRMQFSSFPHSYYRHTRNTQKVFRSLSAHNVIVSITEGHVEET